MNNPDGLARCDRYPLAIDGLESVTSGAYSKFHRWARPSLVALKSLMKHVRNCKAEGQTANLFRMYTFPLTRSRATCASIHCKTSATTRPLSAQQAFGSRRRLGAHATLPPCVVGCGTPGGGGSARCTGAGRHGRQDICPAKIRHPAHPSHQCVRHPVYPSRRGSLSPFCCPSPVVADLLPPSLQPRAYECSLRRDTSQCGCDIHYFR